MITKFKIFEKFTSLANTSIGKLRKQKPNFKEGDTVICTLSVNDKNHKSNNLEKDKEYYITEVEQNFEGVWRCKVRGKKQKYYCFRFLSELEYNADKYNI